MPPRTARDPVLDDPYHNGAALRAWVAIGLTLITILGGAGGWLWHRVERLEDTTADIRRIQAIRGEDIATLKAQITAILIQLERTSQEHHDIERSIMTLNTSKRTH